MMRLAACCLALLAVQGSLAAPPEPRPLTGVGSLHNVFQVCSNVFSGSQPVGEADFASLATAGIRTILSVDGARPEVEAARRHGLRYIHLPFGYDGVPSNRVEELTWVAASVAGPIYVHCHHGRHRGPTATALICLARGWWRSEEALSWLNQAGTSTNYQGLFRSVREFQPPTSASPAGPPHVLPEIARTSDLVQAMVAIDLHHGNLKTLQQSGWQPTAAHPDITPRHEALLLEEQFRELLRMAETRERPAGYRRLLFESLQGTIALRESLASDAVISRPAATEEAFRQVSGKCVECHRTYRD